MNKLLMNLHSTVAKELTYEPLDLKREKLAVFSDLSHATNTEDFYKLCFIILLTDGHL